MKDFNEHDSCAVRSVEILRTSSSDALRMTGYLQRPQLRKFGLMLQGVNDSDVSVDFYGLAIQDGWLIAPLDHSLLC